MNDEPRTSMPGDPLAPRRWDLGAESGSLADLPEERAFHGVDHQRKQEYGDGQLNLEELLVGDINRLRWIRRYGRSLVLHDENVAEHSFYVTMYAYWIGMWVRGNAGLFGLHLDMERLLVRCLFHDADECESGDIDRPFKYHNPTLKELMHIAARDLLRKLLDRLWFSHHPVIDGLMEGWEKSKDKSVEGRILALADYLAFIAYMWQERSHVNFSMAAHRETAKEYAESFNDPSFDFLRPLINDADRIIKAVLIDGPGRPFSLQENK